MSFKDYILNILSESQRKFRQDEHGKYIVYEDSEFAISVNDPNDATYIILWHNEKDKLVNVGSMSVSKIRKGFEDFDIPTSEFLKINQIEINKKFRGLGYGTKMYKILQDYSKDSIKGIVSYLPDRINKKEIPKIYRKFKQVEDGDWHVILFDKKDNQ